MSWVKLDDGFHRNQKQMRMSHTAFRLYVTALSYCAQEREPTGYLTEQQAVGLRRTFGITSRAIAELLELNAWEQANGGYLIHDYEEYLEKGSRDRVRKHRELKRQRNATEAFLARDGYPVPVPVPYPPTPRPAGEGDVTVTYEGGRNDGLVPINRVSLGTLLEKARANREAAQEAEQA